MIKKYDLGGMSVDKDTRGGWRGHVRRFVGDAAAVFAFAVVLVLLWGFS
jgi:hypothetical protein